MIETLPMHATPQEIFTHVRIILGMVLGLGVSRLLLGLARLVRNPSFNRVTLIHLGWTLYAFLNITHFWWFEFNLRIVPSWNYGVYLFFIVYTALYFLMCTLLFPDDDTGRDRFLDERRWFFGLLILITLADQVDTLLKGQDYYQLVYGSEYILQAAAMILLSVLALRTRQLWFHAMFVVLALVYEVVFILGYIFVMS